MNNRPWTYAEITMFRKMWDAGKSIGQCAQALDRTYHAIEKSRKRFGLKPRQGVNGHRSVNHVAYKRQQNMLRETPAQSRLWVKLLADAR